MTFLEALAKHNVIDAKSIDKFQEKISSSFGGDVFRALFEMGVDQEGINEVAEEYYQMDIVTERMAGNANSLFQYIPEDVARIHKIIAVNEEDDVLTLGMVDPHNLAAQNAIQFLFQGQDISYKIAFLPYSLYSKIFSLYQNVDVNNEEEIEEEEEYGASTDDKIDSLEDLINKHEKVEDEDEGENPDKITTSAPVTRTVASILKKAINTGVSDIHIEAHENNSVVRYRLDGILSVELMLPRKMHNAIVARIKVMSRLKLDERRKPQDGRFPARIKNRVVDFRVSTLPTFYGEKVVIRILDPEKGIKSLADTGLTESQLVRVREAIKLPYGIILITGPTGSGKTSTLYAMLEEVDKEGKNVISLEDPIEYKMDGVNQSQVHSSIGYTFSSGLRSILRQDPDVIMVGEIRDSETAELAIQAALTGHLVFSTLHTNSAVGVVPRLVDMGIDPYLIAPTLRFSMAQRLLRKLCTDSAKEIPLDGAVEAIVAKQFETLPDEYKTKLPFSDTLYEAEPSEACPTGKKGRIGVFEMYEVDSGLERIILDSPTEADIYNYIRNKGFTSMREEAILRSMKKLVAFSDTNTL